MTTKLACMTWLVCTLVSSLQAASLDERIAAYEAMTQSPGEADVVAVLERGVQDGRSAEALAVVQPWLNRNVLEKPKGLFYAGQAAEHAGQWLSAVGYYQQLLQQPKPDPKRAGQAVDATYRLLLNALDDPNAAYLYMRNDGHRLRSFGQARRYDAWFLDQAKQRRDLIAMSERLAAMVRDRSTNPADFETAFAWLSQELEQFRKQDPAVYEAVKILAELERTPQPYKARLNWAATVMPYNQKLDELREANAPADSKLTDAPLTAAAALIKAAPDRGPLLVAEGWGTAYDGNQTHRFSVDKDRKLKQLLDAVPQMAVDRRDDLLAMPLARGQIKFDPLSVITLVQKSPDTVNTLDAADIPLFDKDTITVELARELAPMLARNPHDHAALIRGIAESGSLEFSQIADAMMKTEAWRFDKTKPIIDLAYRNSTTRDKAYKQVADQYPDLGNRHTKLKKQVSEQANDKQRWSAFNELYKDLTSKSPSIPGALELWDQLFAHAPSNQTVDMLTKLITNVKGEQLVLLKRALDHARVADARFVYYRPRLRDNYLYNGPQRVRYIKAMASLVPVLEKELEKQARGNELNGILFGLWLRAVDPQSQAAQAFMKKLSESKAYVTLSSAYRDAAADRLRFGHAALPDVRAQRSPQFVSRELLDLPDNANPKAVEQALNAVMKRAEQASTPVTVIGLDPVAKLPQWSDTTRKHVLSLFKENAPLREYPNRQGYALLVERLAQDFEQQEQWQDIETYLPGMWTAAAAPDHGHDFRAAVALIKLAEAALEAEQTAAALAITTSGMNSRTTRMMVDRNSHGLPEMVSRLGRVQGRSSIDMGIIDIPVDEQDPAFPIYRSQAEFAMGNTQAAWDIYIAHADQFIPIVRSLTVPYCLWILEQNIAADETDRAQQIIRELTVWSRQESGRFTSQQEGELKIAYADTAFLKGALQTAKAWYRRVADADEYRGTPLQYEAALKSVDVDRAEKNFSSAMAELDALMRIRDESLRQRVHFARAQVLYDQENFAEAFKEVSTVLRRNPDHPDALILLGEAQLQMRKLMDASEIELGFSRDQEMIVPGESLKINLHDPALNVSGVGADIEVEVWTKSGDRERIKLYQLGDDKTKFRAEIPTRLAKRQTGDKVLQVLGRDEIRYGYSKRFRDKMTDLPPDPDVVIQVASDARLSASAGAFPPREGERRLDLDELGISTAQQALGTRSVRPGNPIYLRVTDPDQSQTDDIDEIAVSVTTSNGDVIPRVTLKETGPHTGEFEATIMTGQAQAMASASESAPGRDPNMTISATDYPGWAGDVGSQATTQTLTIDLNDDVPLGLMTIEAKESSQVPTRFVVQSSMNGRDWKTLARYPDNPPTWLGKPLITAFPTYGRDALRIEPAEGHDVPDDWREKMDILSTRQNVKYGSFVVPSLGDMDLDFPSGGHPGYSVLMRYRAYFYQPAAEIRTFKLTGFPSGDKTNTLFLIDGQPAPEDADDPLTIEREFQPGLHEIEIWRHESRNELVKRKPQLWCNVAGSPELQPCPPEMFDPATFPPAIRDALPMQTKVTASESSPHGFDVAFGLNTRARLVRLVIVEHEGPAPAIHKITLRDLEGQARLPVATDYQKLRNNDQLEVIPGDDVSVRYEDDRSATPRRNTHQARLTVAFNTATISASFLNYVMTDEGRELVLEPIRRFKLDDSIGIVITDPDMDQTREPDRLSFTVQADDGKPITLEALETGPNTGVFLGRVFPVLSKPSRESEVMVRPGGTLIASYLDQENLDPGIPTRRRIVLEHAQFAEPQLAVYDVTSDLLPNASDETNSELDSDERGPEIIEPKRSLTFHYRDAQAVKKQDPNVVIGGTLRFDLLARHLAFAPSSEVVAYVQTESGRKRHQANGETSNQPFDINVPGTMKLQAQPSRYAETQAPDGYVIASPATPPTMRPALDEGRFAFSVPIMLENTPGRSYANQAAETLHHSMLPDALAVRPDDQIHIGFAYQNPQDEIQWVTATVSLDSHAFLDVMDSRYRRDIDTAFVGEKLYIRLIAPDQDTSPQRDVVNVTLTADSGATVSYPLRESDFHSGVFKGSFALTFADQPVNGPLPSVMLNGFPVIYGDRITVSYPTPGDDSPDDVIVEINKGADGAIEPFTKQYGEDAVAIHTTFTLAECYFELAKYHRKMDQESLARREMAQAQKLLAEAIAHHRDDSLKAHAEYLLGNLAQEYADLSKNETAKRRMYQDALARFTKIPLTYPDTEFAPKAQFKKGLVYEKLGELNIAVEEYVKLAYKYPEHELIPSVMSRLGSYFQSQGKLYKDEAEALEKKQGDVDAEGEAIRLRQRATREYLNAAQVFAKLQDRFPTDPLAGLAGLRSAQNFMRAGDYAPAISGFQTVIDNDAYDDRTVRSQAMFWMGISYERIGELREAYETYRRVTFDFPDSVWAKQARGRLADPTFARIIAEEELARERMLEGLIEQQKNRGRQ